MLYFTFRVGNPLVEAQHLFLGGVYSSILGAVNNVIEVSSGCIKGDDLFFCKDTKR